MPGAKTHDLISITVLAIILSGLFYLMVFKQNSPAVGYLDIYSILIFALAYLFATFFLSPDLDIDSTPYKRWGILRILWWPYKVIFKHRGMSHHPIIGPLSILINLIIILLPLVILSELGVAQIPLKFIAAAIIGIVIPIEVHIVADAVISKAKHH